MTRQTHPVEALLDDPTLDLAALCRLAGVAEPWLRERVTLGLLGAGETEPPERWRFDFVDLRRVRRMAGLERDFDAVPELAALVFDLEEELAAMRARLSRLEGFRR
jgi:chaperone modulatory protein CbpM